MQETRFTNLLFGKEIKIVSYDDRDNIEKVLEEAYAEGLRLQKIFNFYDEQSELSKLNRLRKMKVSKELLEVIKKSLKFSKITEGRYDITLGKKILQRKKGLPETSLNCSYKDIKIRGNNIELKNPEAMIDLGSIAKGYITDKVGDFLWRREIREFLIDARGDLLFSGKYFHIIGVQDPRIPVKDIMKIRVRDSGVATSGDYKQFHKTFEKSHILNSGQVISVTTISKLLEDADVIATALFVSDEKTRKKIMKKNKKCSALVIKAGMEKEYYNKFENFIKS